MTLRELEARLRAERDACAIGKAWKHQLELGGPIMLTDHDDHDQVKERLAEQAAEDGIDPALAIDMGAEEYSLLRDKIREGGTK